MAHLIFLVPWLLVAVLVPFAFTSRPRISDAPQPREEEGQLPLVSIVVPARDEAATISTCLASLLDTTYPRREIIVVDDGSVDGTGDIVRILAERSGGVIRVVEGEPLPDGWLGKPWACWQGFQEARGAVLLFTDADTRHDDELLGRAVGALQDSGAGLVSVLPRQLMVSFWERTVLPQIFTILYLRYRNLRRINRSHRPRDVIANGQFILMRRSVYERVGGHEAVRMEVVEDLRMAQRVVQAGERLHLTRAEDFMETRMYRSLGGIMEGWTKNLALGSRQSVDPWLRPVLPWLAGVVLLLFWVAPPVVLLGTYLGPGELPLRQWAAGATALSLAFWTVMTYRFRIPVVSALFYPLGAAVAGALFLRSAARGRRVRWKGREYQTVAGGQRGAA
ncbi:MAG: glycosyltransferase family 2 protein [Gemmatimonadota bacterium]